MKKLIIVVTFLACAAGYSQIEHFEAGHIELMKKDLQALSKDIVKENLALTEEQGMAFWPIYDEYNAAMDKLFDEQINLSAEYMLDYLALSDETAAGLIQKFSEFDQNKLDTQKEYTQKFLEVLPAKVVGKFIQIDHRLDLMIELQRASRIPLIKLDEDE
jgi:hypothetical protein